MKEKKDQSADMIVHLEKSWLFFTPTEKKPPKPLRNIQKIRDASRRIIHGGGGVDIKWKYGPL